MRILYMEGENMFYYRSYRFRIYPTKNNLKKIKQCMAASRLFYNLLLNQLIEDIKNKKINELQFYFQYLDNIIKQNEWLSVCPKEILKSILFDLFDIFKRYSGMDTSEIKKFPNFKSRYYYTNSFKINYLKGNIIVDLNAKKIKIKNFEPIKIKGYKKMKFFPKKIVSATFLSIFDKKYYITVCTQQINDERLQIANKNDIAKLRMIGIDIGVSEFLTTSEGERYENKKFGYHERNRINLLKEKLNAKQLNSKNYIKAKQALEKEYLYIQECRKHYIYDIVNDLLSRYDVIFIEDLNVKSMLYYNRGLTLMIHDASFYKFKQILSQKAIEKRKLVITVHTFFPSSQLCSRCGKRNTEYSDFEKRKYICKYCGLETNRDLNAALNILNEGKRKLYAKVK